MEKCKYEGCGSCSLLKMDYKQQLALKKKKVEDCLKSERVKAKVEDVVGMNFPFKYRNKVHLAVEEFHGRLNIGFYEENSKKIVNIESCLLHDKWLSDLIAIVKKYIRDFKIQPYNRRSGTGTLRYVVARCLGQNIMVTLVVTNQNFGGKEVLYKELKKKFKEVSLYLNINNRNDSAVFSNRFVFKYGEKKLHGSMLGVEFGISPSSFLQINNEIATKIYSRVVEEIKNAKQEYVVDLFSGIGITSLIFAKNGLNVLSVEYEKSSCLDEFELAQINKLEEKIAIVCGKCEEKTKEIEDFAKGKDVAVFIDPPRAGVSQNVLKTICSLSANKFVYLSCNPQTLARDLKFVLNNSNFQIESVAPFDMFPHTEHVESVVTLSLRNSKE